MNKRMQYYSAAWLIALAMFNVIAFVVPGVDNMSKFTVSFWTGYSAIMIAFVGQLACAMIALKEETDQKLFYNISLISVSYTGLILMLIAGGMCMAIPVLPYWVGIVVAILILGFTAIAIVKASAAIEEVKRIDKKVKEQTFFIKALTANANALVASVKLPEIKEQAKKVYDAIRYSDPMSNTSLTETEAQISDKFNEFTFAVKTGDAEKSKAVAEELLLLIRSRNQKCNLLK